TSARLRARRSPRPPERKAALPASEQREEVRLGQQWDPLAFGLRQLGPARLLADDEPARLLRHRIGHLRAERLQRGLGVLARERLERSCDHVGRSRQRTLARPFLVSGLETEAQLAQLLHEGSILL